MYCMGGAQPAFAPLYIRFQPSPRQLVCVPCHTPKNCSLTNMVQVIPQCALTSGAQHINHALGVGAKPVPFSSVAAMHTPNRELGGQIRATQAERAFQSLKASSVHLPLGGHRRLALPGSAPAAGGL